MSRGSTIPRGFSSHVRPRMFGRGMRILGRRPQFRQRVRQRLPRRPGRQIRRRQHARVRQASRRVNRPDDQVLALFGFEESASGSDHTSIDQIVPFLSETINRPVQRTQIPKSPQIESQAGIASTTSSKAEIQKTVAPSDPLSSTNLETLSLQQLEQIVRQGAAEVTRKELAHAQQTDISSVAQTDIAHAQHIDISSVAHPDIAQAQQLNLSLVKQTDIAQTQHVDLTKETLLHTGINTVSEVAIQSAILQPTINAVSTEAIIKDTPIVNQEGIAKDAAISAITIDTTITDADNVNIIINASSTVNATADTALAGIDTIGHTPVISEVIDPSVGAPGLHLAESISKSAVISNFAEPIAIYAETSSPVASSREKHATAANEPYIDIGVQTGSGNDLASAIGSSVDLAIHTGPVVDLAIQAGSVIDITAQTGSGVDSAAQHGLSVDLVAPGDLGISEAILGSTDFAADLAIVKASISGQVKIVSTEKVTPSEIIVPVGTEAHLENVVPLVKATSSETVAESLVPIKIAMSSDIVVPTEIVPAAKIVVPVETGSYSETVVPVETVLSAEIVVPVENSPSSEMIVPVETVSYIETVVPVEMAPSTGLVVVPVETSQSSDILVPVEKAPSVAIVVSVEAAASAEIAVPVNTAQSTRVDVLAVEIVPSSEIVVPLETVRKPEVAPPESLLA